MSRFTLALLLAFPVAASAAPTKVKVDPRTASVCSTFANLRDEEPNVPGFGVYRRISEVKRASGSRLAPRMTQAEQLMVQMVALNSSDRALTPKEANELFFQLHEQIPSLDGSIEYGELLNKVTGKRYDIAIVTFFPGDNEYGALFRVHTNPSNPRDVSVNFIGTIEDGDVLCLRE